MASRILGFRRSRRGHMLYYIVHDEVASTLSVRRCLSWTSQSEHCKTFEVTRHDRTHFAVVLRRAKVLCDALSRMSAAEERKQAAAIQQHGEVR